MKRLLLLLLYIILGIGSATGMGISFGMFAKEDTSSSEIWDNAQVFDIAEDVAATFEIGNGKHEEGFVILNLADIQIDSLGSYADSFALLDKVIKATDPDLITLTGDQVWKTFTKSGLKKICAMLDKTGIPWAPVLGNHDGEGQMSRSQNGDVYLRYNNVVFRKNDPSLGVGNYIINLTDSGKPVHSIFMMDSHNSRNYPEGNSGYDYIWENQIDWYAWGVKGLQAVNSDVTSSCFFHIPLVQYEDAWKQGAAYGEKRESVGCANHGKGGYDSGLFAKIKELGSTDLVVVGHDHINNYYADYEGVTLAYALKSSYGCYYDSDMVGGTTITIAKDGSHTLKYYYYNKADGSVTCK